MDPYEYLGKIVKIVLDSSGYHIHLKKEVGYTSATHFGGLMQKKIIVRVLEIETRQASVLATAYIVASSC